MSEPARRPRAARQWDRRAATWDRRSAGVERRYLVRERDWVADRAGGDVLEVGVGTGANLPHYRDDVDLTAIDLSPAMLERARVRADRIDRSVRLLVAPADALPFDDDSFDSLVCTFTLCSVPDVRAALVEALRVLRPGGSLLLADHVRSTAAGYALLQRAVDLLSGPIAGEYFARRPLAVLREIDADVVETGRSGGFVAMEHVHVRA